MANRKTAWADTREKGIAYIQEWAANLREEGRSPLLSRSYFYLYPPGFWMAVGSLRSCDPSALETAVVFLEADPWCFHSGYVKAKLLRYLKKREFEIPRPYAERLVRVILTAVDTRGGWEFKWFCRLARKLRTPELRQELTRRANGGEPKVQRRARYLIDYLETGRWWIPKGLGT